MRRVIRGSAVAVALLLVAGCSQGVEPPVTDPTASATPSASASPETSPSPTVDPAAGIELTAELTSGTMTIRAPDNYVTDERLIEPEESTAVLNDGSIHTFIQLQIDEDSPAGNADLNAFAERRLGLPLTTGDQQVRLPDVVVDGVTFYQISGPDPVYEEWLYEFGVRYDGYDIFIIIRSDLDTPEAEREATNAAVLASGTMP